MSCCCDWTQDLVYDAYVALNNVRSYAPDGTLRWQMLCPYYALCCSHRADGALYVGTGEGDGATIPFAFGPNLFLLSPRGQIIWTFRVAADLGTSTKCVDVVSVRARSDGGWSALVCVRTNAGAFDAAWLVTGDLAGEAWRFGPFTRASDSFPFSGGVRPFHGLNAVWTFPKQFDVDAGDVAYGFDSGTSGAGYKIAADGLSSSTSSNLNGWRIVCSGSSVLCGRSNSARWVAQSDLSLTHSASGFGGLAVITTPTHGTAAVVDEFQSNPAIARSTKLRTIAASFSPEIWDYESAGSPLAAATDAFFTPAEELLLVYANGLVERLDEDAAPDDDFTVLGFISCADLDGQGHLAVCKQRTTSPPPAPLP